MSRLLRNGSLLVLVVVSTSCRATFERVDGALNGAPEAGPAAQATVPAGVGVQLAAGVSPLAIRPLPPPAPVAESASPGDTGVGGAPHAPVAGETTTPASRPVVDASGFRGPVVLDQPGTIYDFAFSRPGDVIIAASGIEARNIRGPGLRRIDASAGDISDAGFRNAEFTFAHIRMRGGSRVIRPYFVEMTDVNPQPNVGDGDIVQIFAYEGDIVEPLIERVVVRGKQRPAGSSAHNDAIQFTGIAGGRVLDPTIRDSTVLGASSAAVQAKEVYGTFTIEGTTLTERYGSYHAVIAKPGGGSAVMLWRGNTLLDASSVAATGGWRLDPRSDALPDGVVIS